jgi:hypothetical protein
MEQFQTTIVEYLIEALRSELLRDPQLRALANGYSIDETERSLMLAEMFGDGDFVGRPEGR